MFCRVKMNSERDILFLAGAMLKITWIASVSVVFSDENFTIFAMLENDMKFL